MRSVILFSPLRDETDVSPGGSTDRRAAEPFCIYYHFNLNFHQYVSIRFQTQYRLIQQLQIETSKQTQTDVRGDPTVHRHTSKSSFIQLKLLPHH